MTLNPETVGNRAHIVGENVEGEKFQYSLDTSSTKNV